MTRADGLQERSDYVRAFQAIASEVGEGSKLHVAMGSLAWGRLRDFDPQPGEHVDHIWRGVGYLHGVRDALLAAAQLEIWDGEASLRRIHERIAGYAQERKR